MMYQNRQAYAPTPHSYIPNTTLSATINLDEVRGSFLTLPRNPTNAKNQEVKLAETRAERDLQDSLAEVFSIIITLDELEKAYLKDAIPESDYTEICDRLLKQYKAILTDEAVAKEYVDLETFKNEWDVCDVCQSLLISSILTGSDGSTPSYRTNPNWSPFHRYSTFSRRSDEQQWNEWHADSRSNTRLYNIPRCFEAWPISQRSTSSTVVGTYTISQ
jgi:hypothetical protein